MRPQERREDGLTSTPRQKPSWEKRGGWGQVAMISRVLRFQSLEVLLRWFVGPIPWLLLLSFSFFFFVIMDSLFLRYKKPHAALAMERTKPINQKQITKESHSTS